MMNHLFRQRRGERAIEWLRRLETISRTVLEHQQAVALDHALDEATRLIRQQRPYWQEGQTWIDRPC